MYVYYKAKQQYLRPNVHFFSLNYIVRKPNVLKLAGMSLVVLTFAERNYSCTNLVLCSNEEQALEMSALESLYGGQINYH